MKEILTLNQAVSIGSNANRTKDVYEDEPEAPHEEYDDREAHLEEDHHNAQGKDKEEGKFKNSWNLYLNDYWPLKLGGNLNVRIWTRI